MLAWQMKTLDRMPDIVIVEPLPRWPPYLGNLVLDILADYNIISE